MADTGAPSNPPGRTESYGQQDLSFLERVGVSMSRRKIVRCLPKKSALEVLDCGCGYRASLLSALRPFLARGVGIDVRIDPHCREIPGLEFIEKPLEASLPALADSSFDVVLLISVLEHVWQPVQVLAQCKRVLRDGGTLLANVPTWRGKFFLEYVAFRRNLSRAEMDDHKMYYDKRDLWPLLVQAGFKPSGIRMSYHKFGLNLFAVCRKGAQ